MRSNPCSNGSSPRRTSQYRIPRDRRATWATLGSNPGWVDHSVSSELSATIPFVEALVGRETSLHIAKMPFSEMSCGIAFFREHLGDGLFPLHKPVGPPGDRHAVRTGANRVPPSHHTRPARRALRLNIEIEQLRAFAGEPVDVRRRCAPQEAAAVTNHFAVSEVVHQDEQDVRIHVRAALLPRHRDIELVLCGDQMILVVLSDVELYPVDRAGEFVGVGAVVR
jgi:hypothetical protein